jgi:hypothetical protein
MDEEAVGVNERKLWALLGRWLVEFLIRPLWERHNLGGAELTYFTGLVLGRRRPAYSTDAVRREYSQPISKSQLPPVMES